MQYVIIRADGGVSLFKHESDEAATVLFNKWKQSARAEWLPATLDKTSDPLPDASFHGSRATRGPKGQPADNAWQWDAITRRVVIDMVRAREVHRERLRQLRAPLLAALDADYLRADELGDLLLKAEIAVKKQALRDVTADPAIEVARTPEELKAVMPAALR